MTSEVRSDAVRRTSVLHILCTILNPTVGVYVYCVYTFQHASVSAKAGKFIYRFQECLDFASKSNNLTDRFLFFLHFEAVLLNFLSSFIYIS